jgi:hypothetical protein
VRRPDLRSFIEPKDRVPKQADGQKEKERGMGWHIDNPLFEPQENALICIEDDERSWVLNDIPFKQR